MNNFHTAYDDVFRTLTVDCKTLMIPVVNEGFHANYLGTEKITLFENEIFMKQQDGSLEKIITDSSFEIISLNGEIKRYHLECQSTSDNSMLIRMYEYDSQLALKNAELIQHTLTVKFPESAILYLRHDNSIPDVFQIVIQTPKGSISYGIPVLKVEQYDIDTIFQKNLLFFIPFYIFSYEKQFKKINQDKTKLASLKQEYISIVKKLEELVQQGVINEYTKKTICEMSERVMKRIAAKYDHIRKEVLDVMGGKVLEYEAKTILRAGIKQGHEFGLKEGQAKGKLDTLCDLVHDGLLSIEEAAKRANMTVEKFQRQL